MNKVEHYKNRSMEIMEHAMFCENRPLDEDYTFEDFLKLSKGQKLLHILYRIKDAIPENFFEKHNLKKFFYDTEHLPFNPDKYSFEGIKGHGATAMVYLLKNFDKDCESWVLKVYKDEYIQENFESLMEAATFFRNEFEEVKLWYKDELEHVFLPELPIITHSPKDKESLIFLQPYQGQKIRDIFLEYTIEEIKALTDNDQELKKDLTKFAELTLEHAREKSETLDLIGCKNVSIVYNEQDERVTHNLKIIDPHWIHSTQDEKDESFEQTNTRLRQLEDIYDAIK